MEKNSKTLKEKNARKKHKDSLKASRRIEPSLKRNKPTKIEKENLLIVCEGKNTEPSYFDHFSANTIEIKTVGTGCNTLSLVNEAKNLFDENKDKYDQVWCVFDADPKPDNSNQSKNFNDAIRKAESYKFKVAYSNQAFEYWIILHFEDLQGGGMHRNEYNERINRYLKPYKLKYDGKGSKIITEEIFDLLESVDESYNKERKILAIERAKRIYSKYDHKNWAKEESSTTVF